MEGLDNLYARKALHPEPKPAGSEWVTGHPLVSALGSRLIPALEAAIGQTIACGACKSYLRSLDRTPEPVEQDIIDQLMGRKGGFDLPVSVQIREQLGSAQAVEEMLRQVIAPIFAEEYAKRVLPVPPKPKKQDGRNWPDVLPIDLTESVRHLMYHLWPIAGVGAWQWNLDQLAQRWALFNGAKVISIATDASTDTVEAVIEFCRSRGMVWDTVISGPNQGIGEAAYWQQKIAALPQAEANHVVFYAHGKGAQQRTFTEAVRLWTELMYQSNLDYWPAVRDTLQTKLFCGVLRYLGLYRLPGNFRWHYAGTFYWFRWADIQHRHPEVIHRDYVGTEAWPGGKCRRDEAGVLFGDGIQSHGFLYDLTTMQGLWQQWAKWKHDQLKSGPS